MAHWTIPPKCLFVGQGFKSGWDAYMSKGVLKYFRLCHTASSFLIFSSHFFFFFLFHHLMSRQEAFIRSFRLHDPPTPKGLPYWLELPSLERRVREAHFRSVSDIFWAWFYDSFYIFQPMFLTFDLAWVWTLTQLLQELWLWSLTAPFAMIILNVSLVLYIVLSTIILNLTVSFLY